MYWGIIQNKNILGYFEKQEEAEEATRALQLLYDHVWFDCKLLTEEEMIRFKAEIEK